MSEIEDMRANLAETAMRQAFSDRDAALAKLAEVEKERDDALVLNTLARCSWCGETVPCEPERMVAHMHSCAVRKDAYEDQLRAAESRLAEVEGQAGALREILQEIRPLLHPRVGAVLDSTDAGRALLEEVAALRKVRDAGNALVSMTIASHDSSKRMPLLLALSAALAEAGTKQS